MLSGATFKPNKQIFLSTPSRELLLGSINGGWFDDDSINWRMGYGRGIAGAVAFRSEFLRALEIPDEEVKVLGVYKGIEPIGFAYLEPISEAHKVVRLKLFLSPESQGKGWGNTALIKISELIFNSGAYRLECEVLRINKEAIGWLRKLGFTQEAIRRSSHWMDNNVFDTVVLRLLKHEFNKMYGGSGE